MARRRTSVAFYAGKQQNQNSEDRHCAVDAHGDIDLYSEFGWQNVKIITDRRQKQIQGVNLNCMLKGIFILYGFETVGDTTLPGGFYSWEVLLESFFISMTHLCTVDDIIRRINYLIELYINGDGQEGSIDGDNYAVGNVLYGAFSFLMYWMLSFNAYVSDTHLTKLRSGIIGLGQKLNAPQDELMITKNKYSYNYSDTLEKLRLKYQELSSVAYNVTQSRLLNTVGISRQLSVQPSAHSYSDITVMTFVHQRYVQPNLQSNITPWAGYDANLKKEELKKTLAKAPPVKLEIFGADAMLDESDEEEENVKETNSCTFGDRKSSPFDETKALPPAPTVRVSPGFGTLQEPYTLSMDLFTLDPLELARQWTLADHALFCSIALPSLIPPPGTNASIASLSRSQQAKLGALGTGIFGGCRAFIDRFNALSAWVTFSVLSHADLDGRVQKVSFFVRLAMHLAELANFNGLMIVLTALQQGCISRLKLTFERLPKSEVLKLSQLQKVMSGLKNYQRYRLEVAKLSPYFCIATSDAVEATGGSGGGRGSGDGVLSLRPEDVDVAWKREVVERYKPEPGGSSHSIAVAKQGTLQASEEVSRGLMRSNSMNKMMGKAHSLDRDDTPWGAAFSAIVPHLGAHLAEITSVTEGNGDYLIDRPYLFNTHKLALLAGTLSLLRKMQQMQYNLTPVRTIVAALNFTAKTHLKLSPVAASEYAKKMYALSEAVEPTGSVAPAAGADLHSPSERASMVGGGRRSEAYRRITGGGAASSGEEEEGDSSEEDEDDSERKPKKKLLSRPFKLLRTLTSKFMSSGTK